MKNKKIEELKRLLKEKLVNQDLTILNTKHKIVIIRLIDYDLYIFTINLYDKNIYEVSFNGLYNGELRKEEYFTEQEDVVDYIYEICIEWKVVWNADD